MRVNTFKKDKEIRKPYASWYLAAGIMGVVVGVALVISFKLGKILLKLIIKYWWAALIILLIFLFFRIRRKKIIIKK